MSRFFVDHPVFAWVVSIVIVLAGGACVVTLPIADAPNGHYTIPVKFWTSLSLGTMAVILNSIKVDGADPLGMGPKS